MKFTNMVASLVLVTAMAAQAQAQNSDAGAATAAQPGTQGVVILNSNTNSTTAATVTTATTVEQPATVVEAAPAVESKAEKLRKQRKGVEVKTEETIVEKLEESRMKEEQERADRLFGDKFDAPKAAPVTTPAPQAAVVEEQKPTQVTIEKVEIVQPAAPAVVVKEANEEPVLSKSQLKAELATEEVAESSSRFYVGGLLGGLNYDASNVKENYGVGVAVGTILDNTWGLEASFLYSNSYIDTFWTAPFYKELDQYDFQVSTKYYILSGALKPYVGGSASYIYRKYQDRLQDQYSFGYEVPPNEQETHAINLGLAAGVDFALNEHWLIGGGIDWNTNIMNKNEINYNAYNVRPADTKDLEEIDYTTLKVYGKVSF